MLKQPATGPDHLHTARRIFSLVPVVVFFVALVLMAEPSGQSPSHFLQVLLRVTGASLASAFVCIAAYGFYKYMHEKSFGL